MNNSKPIFELHAAHEEWLKSLSFYKDEVALMQQRIEEIISKNSNTEVRVAIEHFQNQLIVQREQMDILKHSIKEQETALDDSVKNNMVALDRSSMPDAGELYEQMEDFERIFEDLRKEFGDFLAKWM